MSDENEVSSDPLEEDTEMDRMALDLVVRMRLVRSLVEEVLRRWRAGEHMACEVQRRIFQAAFKMERLSRRMDQDFSR